MSATQQQQAYDAGVQDGLMTGVEPKDLKFVQDFNGYDGETLVCYLNGVGDGVAGISARGDLLKAVPSETVGLPAGTDYIDLSGFEINMEQAERRVLARLKAA